MKKLIFVLLAILMFAVLVSCGGDYADPAPEFDYQGPLSIKRLEAASDGLQAETIIDFTEEAQEKILDYLNKGKWYKNGVKCNHDVEITAKNAKCQYHSACGRFVDSTNGSYMTLSQKDKLALNTLLGIDPAGQKEPSGQGISVKMYLYEWSGAGISSKTIENDSMAYQIASVLSALAETGETIPKVGEGSIHDTEIYESPVDRGTLWIEIDCLIYRFDRDRTQLCLVDGHFGEGRVLAFTDEVKKLITNAWHYYPKDVYSGTYTYKTDSWTVKHVYEGNTTVQITIKDIEIQKKNKSENKITLEVTSSIDQTVKLKSLSARSDDTLGSSDSESLEMKADQPQTAEMTFIGWADGRYWVTIGADNTRLELTIEMN